MTDIVTDLDKQNFHKQRLKTVGRVYIQEEINEWTRYMYEESGWDR